MRTLINKLFTLALVVLILSCSGDDSPEVNPIQSVIDGLGKSWTTTSVIFENQDVTADWTGFTLTFDKLKGYQTTELSNESVLVWPTTGSYTFPKTDTPNLVERSDGVQITIENLTESSAKLVFQIAGRSTGGRDEALIGEWVFEMESI